MSSGIFQQCIRIYFTIDEETITQTDKHENN